MEDMEATPGGSLPAAVEVAIGSPDANFDPHANDDTPNDPPYLSAASEASSAPQQQPNCDVAEVPDAAALLAAASGAPDLRRSSSSGGVASSRGAGFGLGAGIGRRSRSRSGGDDSDRASSELVLQLQRLCRRQRQRSEERAFVRDVERVLALLRVQAPASAGAGVTSATFPGPELSLTDREALGSVQEEDEAAGEDGRSSVMSSSSTFSSFSSLSSSDRLQISRVTLTLAEIDALLDCIADLFDHRNSSVRALAFEVVQLCLLRFGERLTPALRRKIYLRLETHPPGDFLLQQKALRALTQDGRHLEPFHVELGWFLLRLLEQSDAQRDLLGLIQSILRRSPRALDRDKVIAIVSVISARCDMAWSRNDWDACRRFVAFYQVLAAHDLAHAASTPACLRSLCCLVNADGHGTWSVMKLLLNGSSGFLVLRGLLQLLEHPTGSNSPWVLRGAVFFVGMSCWGSQRVAKFDDIAWAPILLALEEALQCCRGVVVFEVILSIQRLIKKFGAAQPSAGSMQSAASSVIAPAKSLSGDSGHDTTTASGATTSSSSSNRDKRHLVMEWDIILRMLQTLRPWVSMTDENGIEEAPQRTMHVDSRRQEAKANRTATIYPANELPDQPQHQLSVSIQQTRIPRELLDTLQAVEDLVEQHLFAGDVDEFLHILEDYLPHLSENSMLFLLRQRAEAAHPGYHLDWLSTLSAAMRTFFSCVSRDGDALPVPNAVRLEALEILRINLWTSRNVCEDRVIEEVVIPTLGRVYEDTDAEVRHRALEFIIEVARQLESVKFDSLLDILASAMTISSNEDAQLVAASGIVALFSSAFDHLPPARAVRMYDLLATTVETHRSRAVRNVALSCLLYVCEARATDGKLQWMEQQQVRTSRFLFVSRRAARINAAGVQLTAACVPVARALRALLTLVSAEPDAELFRMAVKGIKTMLENRAILEDVDVSEVSAKVVASIDYRAFGRAAIPDEVEKLLHDPKSTDANEAALIPRDHKSQEDSRRAGRSIPLTDAELVRSIHASTRPMGIGGSDNPEVSYCASVQATAALLAKTRFLAMGIELLQLLVSYEAELHDNAVQELTRCLISAMKLRLAVAEKDLFAGGTSGDDSTLSSSQSSPNMLYRHDEAESDLSATDPYASGTPLGFTSRVLSRFQTSASHGNLFHALSGSVSKPSLGSASARTSTSGRPTRKYRARLQAFLRQLFESEFKLLHTTTTALSLLTLLAPTSVLGQLDDILQSLRRCVTTVDGDFRPDAFVAVLELLGTILPILADDHEDSALPARKAIVEALLLGFEYAKSRQLAYLAFPTALPPLPAYDGIGGSPSYYCDSAQVRRQPPRNMSRSASRGHVRQAEGDDGHEGSPNRPAIRAIREDTEENDYDAETLRGRVESEDDQSGNEMDDFSLNDSRDEPPSIPVLAPRVLYFSNNGDSTSAGLAASGEMHEPSTLSNEDQYDPTYLMMHLFDITVENRPQLLSDGPSLKLALSVLDRTPEYETHKIGLLYVRDEKQSSESAILGNAGGSLRYLRFLRGLGSFTKLEGLSGYTGGLDTANNSDGKFGLVYKDACAQIMFHVATMMVPESSRSAADNFSSMKKKRHIGNDFVHVVFKECDEDYDLQTLSGQFNDVHIVIQPLNDSEYRTEVHVKPGIPPFGPLYGKQIVSSPIISESVRLTCLNANLACQVFHQDLVGFALNCEERLKQIKQLGLRLATADEWKLDD
ncbi:Tuberous sclerosis 2-like protein [Phytophthora pseudosyringae]|uniref:Tuberous sclerosis 2-like protein n=1 Tax=Phytophthora pseudosyringae TaxID=221518 RepID=A0A8T1WKM8_9STRA|nr:Tuberous sclerosis 2-like protein [Phytophthora pseudosyringae]